MRAAIACNIWARSFGLGFFWIIVDNRQQGFYDRLANTSVIYAWRATGRARLLERVRTRFGMQPPHTATVDALPAPQPTAGSYELLAFAASDFALIATHFHTTREMVANREIAVLATDLLNKTTDGQVDRIRTKSLPPGTEFRGLTGLHAMVTPSQIAAVTCDLPPASDILAVLLEDQAADALVRQLTRGTTVLVRRCEIPAIPATAICRRPREMCVYMRFLGS